MIKRLKRAAKAFILDEKVVTDLDVMEEARRIAKEDLEVGDIDRLIFSLFQLLSDEAPDSGAMCISLEDGSIVIAAESIQSAANVVSQYSDSLIDEIAEEHGYFGGIIDA